MNTQHSGGEFAAGGRSMYHIESFRRDLRHALNKAGTNLLIYDDDLAARCLKTARNIRTAEQALTAHALLCLVRQNVEAVERTRKA